MPRLAAALLQACVRLPLDKGFVETLSVAMDGDFTTTSGA
jgi:hypothetical protein